MGSKWTDEQLQAINERGRNILVSAGAGSGKTAVMVERVMRLIMEDKIPVSAMLIVTFTNAAAAEMKERLRTALKDRLSELAAGTSAGTAGSTADREWVKEQLDALHTAQISTFHSFAQKVLKEFFYFTDIEPGFRVLDEAEAEVLKEQAVEELFDGEYENAAGADANAAGEGNDFTAFLDSYSGEKNDSRARELILNIYRKLEAVPDRFEVLESKAADLAKDAEEFSETETYRKLTEMIRNMISQAVETAEAAEMVLRDEDLDSLADAVKCDIEMIMDADKVISESGLEKAVSMLRSIKFSTVAARKKDDKEKYTDDIKARIKALRENYKSRIAAVTNLYYDDLDSMMRTMHLTEGSAKTLCRLVESFDGIFSRLKRDMNSIDYSDMEHYAYEILKHDEACGFYRNAFRYIFIDEYQDTNIMQETIISRIRRPDNLFMVGDIKQSIYHFRLADPDIFKARYKEYSKGAGDSVKIDLNRNFRSKPEVLTEINNMFRPLMEGYDENAELRPGSDDAGITLCAPETHIIDTAGEEYEEDDELRDMQKEELEAAETVRIIKQMLGKEYTFTKTGETRKISYRDIVILMRSFRRSAEGYREVFREAGIPLYIDDRSGYFDSIEINVFMSLLQVIDNKRQDVPFIALLRSEIFGFSCSELAEIRKLHPEGSYVDAAESAADDPAAPERLREKCRKVFDDIKKWQAYAVTIPLPDMIWRLMNETGYYIVAGTLPGGAVRQANLRLLADRARDYSEQSLGSLYGFIQYIEKVKANKVDMPQAALLSENDDVVRIMTVHHSKGLEFPVVILAGMNNSHRNSPLSEIMFDREDGLGMRAVDPADHVYEDSLISRLILAKERISETDEMKRVFYVAVTRARETFFLVGTADFDKIMQGIETSDHSDTTLMKMSRYLPNVVRIAPDELKDALEHEEADKEPVRVELTEEELSAVKRLDYEYPFSQAFDIAAKTSVTALNKAMMEAGMAKAAGVSEDDTKSVREMQDEEESRMDAGSSLDEDVPLFIQGKHGVTAAERGTAYHGVMERIDFSRASREGVPYICKKMAEFVQDGIFTEDEMRAVEPGKIEKFFETDLGKRAVTAFEHGRLRREQTFELSVKIEGEDVLVQGVIDCCFEEPDGIVLLDYKTNSIDRRVDFDDEKKRLVSMYEKQLDIYADALEQAIGTEVKEKYLYLFAADSEVRVE